MMDPCTGCGLSNKCGLKRRTKERRKLCPCAECLVKAICIDRCEKRSIYFTNIRDGIFSPRSDNVRRM